MGDEAQPGVVNGFLLDTTVVIDWWRGDRSVVNWLEAVVAGGRRLVLSPITVTEALAGVPPKYRAQRVAQLAAYEFQPLSFEVARLAGELAFDHARQGTRLPIPDLLQAALAKTLGLTVATSNPRHFSEVETVDPRQFRSTGGPP